MRAEGESNIQSAGRIDGRQEVAEMFKPINVGLAHKKRANKTRGMGKATWPISRGTDLPWAVDKPPEHMTWTFTDSLGVHTLTSQRNALLSV